jgi:cytidylate kinase
MGEDGSMSTNNPDILKKGVVTISRQLGSRGLGIAHALGSSLGYRVASRDLINQAAMRSGNPEVALAVIDELDLLGISPSPEASQSYHLAVRQVMEELLQEGSVIIVGRAGQVILRDIPLVLHVRIIAPQAERTQRIASDQNISIDNALAQVQASDRHRRNYLKRHYQVNWDDLDLYDLTLNTARLSIRAAAVIIQQALIQKLENATAATEELHH